MTDASKSANDEKAAPLWAQQKIATLTRQRDGLAEALEEVRKIARGETFTKGDCDAVNKCGAIADDALAAAAKETP